MPRMNRKFHIRMAALLAALLLLLPVIPVAQAASGSCGDGVTWSLTGGVLTVSGKGAMKDYRESSPAPWAEYADAIGSVIIEKGVTKVGSYAFFAMENITAVSFADSVSQVGSYAFYDCKSLSLLNLGYGLQKIGESAFERCKALLSVRLPNSLETIDTHAFYRCESLQTVTVPASVTELGAAAFGYCKSLQSAQILARVEQLPAWTFYGCENLKSVTLNPAIAETGVEAFEGCDLAQAPVYDVVEKNEVTHSSTVTDESGVTTQQQFISTPNSTVNTQVTGSQTTLDAVVENDDGWDEVAQQAGSANGDVQVNIHLKGETEVTGDQLGDFAGKDVSVTIHTQQGALWHFNGKDLDKDDLSKKYELSFTLKTLTDRTDAQKAAVGLCDAFIVEFSGKLDFKTEVELPLGAKYAASVAAFFEPVKQSYNRLQDVLVDNNGAAHFYLGSVKGNTEYLIGINVSKADSGSVSDAIIPDSMKPQYGNPEQVEEIEYIVTGAKSSWGMDINQVTWILVGVMLGSVVVVGTVVFIQYKRKLKKGYIPGADFEE